MYRVSADIGGTFTDIVVEDTSKKNIKTIKVLSTPENPANAVFEGLNSNLDIKDINFIVHGTTVGLNAFLERKGSRVLLLMTKGISDTYTIARGDRKELYNVQYSKPGTLVPRKDVVEQFCGKALPSHQQRRVEVVDERSHRLTKARPSQTPGSVGRRYFYPYRSSTQTWCFARQIRWEFRVFIHGQSDRRIFSPALSSWWRPGFQPRQPDVNRLNLHNLHFWSS